MAGKVLPGEIASVAALGDPIRRRLYEFVAQQGESVSRDMAAAGVEIARHVAKFHLDKLEEEGLLETEYRRPSGKKGPGAGRPTKYYRRSSREISVSLPERHYDLAARVLAQAITMSQKSNTPIALALEKAAITFGQLMAQEVHTKLQGGTDKVDVANAISEVLDDHGYEPRMEEERLVLANCPFHSLATEYTALICGINHNLMSALINDLPRSYRADLAPAPGRCCVTLNEI
ncbi:MAG TPA: transcriptional regulator [Candidatus Nanopelagicaceae bacterium]|jgi:predicted ArsR family transcriptional regulator